MLLNELRAPAGATKNKKRRGRGESSGLGKTSGRGSKGQKARAGGFHKVGFEGGQMPLQRRIPKRGFFSLFRTEYAVVNVGDLSNKFKANDVVDVAALKKMGLINSVRDGLKILGTGEISISLTVKAAKFSQSAREKIEKAGGQALVLGAEKVGGASG